jgi:hypothetical protein
VSFSDVSGGKEGGITPKEEKKAEAEAKQEDQAKREGKKDAGK